MKEINIEASHIYDERILILDFGSQYTQIIARRVREIGVYCEVLPWNISNEDVEKFSPTGIILSGGPRSVNDENRPEIPEMVLDIGCPVLGICYGMQAMAELLGGKVARGSSSEYGAAKVEIHGHSSLLTGIEDTITADGISIMDVWMSHGDHVEILPEGFKVIASTEDLPIAGMANEERRIYGLQFHPEVTHTRQGMRLISRFVKDICGCEALWKPENIVDSHVAQIKDQVGSDKVVLGLSGGVDSAVAAALIHKAIGDQLICVFVDTGLLRLNEVEELKATFAENQGMQVIVVDAKERFLSALAGVDEPERKRKIIGELFIDVFDEEAEKIQDVKWLAQGTIYSDVIESAGNSTADVIKSHHNVGGLPERMNLKLLEPLRDLFKDEVRNLGITLGLPHDRVFRHPFPGPGLALRVIGEVKEEYLDILRPADNTFIQMLREEGLYDQASQAFVVFLPVKTVGVRGDQRHYEYVVSLRAVQTIDFMTAHWMPLSHDFLERVATRIMNEVPGVARVVYDISHKPPATIEWE